MDSPGTMGALLALAVGVVKLLEKLTEWGFGKMRSRKNAANGHTNGHSSHLDTETALVLKEIHGIVSIRDHDGVPLVYWPRSQIETQKEIAETLRDISRSNDKMVDRLEQVVDNTRNNGK